MTPITRKQARELAKKHGWRKYAGDNEFHFDESEIVAMLTDFRQQVIADLERESGAMPEPDVVVDHPVGGRYIAHSPDSFRESVASLQAKLEQARKELRIEKGKNATQAVVALSGAFDGLGSGRAAMKGKK